MGDRVREALEETVCEADPDWFGTDQSRVVTWPINTGYKPFPGG